MNSSIHEIKLNLRHFETISLQGRYYLGRQKHHVRKPFWANRR